MRNNKMVMILAIVMGVLLVVVIGVILVITISKNKDASKKIIVETPTNLEESIQAEEEKKKTDFNDKFKGYEGEEISATLVKSLLSEVVLTNNTDEEHQVIVKIIGTSIEDGTKDTTEISSAQREINDEYIYNVSLEFSSEDGYVSEITIEGEKNTSPEIQAFNRKFKQYEDTELTGVEVKTELAEIIKESNQQNSEHKIIMYSGDLKSINDIKDEAKYKITFSYDDEGYLTRIDADEQSGNNNNPIERENETANEIENRMNNVLQQYQDDISERSSDEDL